MTLDRLRGFIRAGGGVPRRRPGGLGAHPPPGPVARREPLLSFFWKAFFAIPDSNSEDLKKNRQNSRGPGKSRSRALPALGVFSCVARPSIQTVQEKVPPHPPPNYSDNCLKSPLGAVFRQLEIDSLNFFRLCAAPTPNPLLSTVPSAKPSLHLHMLNYNFPPHKSLGKYNKALESHLKWIFYWA